MGEQANERMSAAAVRVNGPVLYASISLSFHCDSGQIENWTKIFHCPKRSGASE